jgi:assimilatory nitrate reductase catalytic subunit
MGVNALTNPVFCPTSKQPELKHTAVKILKAEMPWSLLGVAWLPEADALAAREKLKSLMAQFPFASVVPFGRERTGLLFRAASHEAAPDATIAHIEALLGLDGSDVLRYADKKKGQRRAVKLERTADNAHLTGFVLAGDTRAEVWIKTLLQDQLPALAYGRLLLAPGAKAPVAVKARGKQVCTCFNVSEDAIRTELANCRGFEDERLGQLQSALKCGTNCGSCLPEVRKMVRISMPAKVAA